MTRTRRNHGAPFEDANGRGGRQRRLALENDVLEGALIKAGLVSAKQARILGPQRYNLDIGARHSSYGY